MLTGIASLVPFVILVAAVTSGAEDFVLWQWVIIFVASFGSIVHMLLRPSISYRGKWLWLAGLLVIWPVAIPTYWFLHVKVGSA